MRRGPVNFSHHPDLADTSDPPDSGGDTLLLEDGGPEPLVSTSVVPRSASPTSNEGGTTSAVLLPLPTTGVNRDRAGDGGIATSTPLLLDGSMDDPSTMTLDQILEKLAILDKLSERRWESMNARHSEVLLQCKTLDIKLGFHTESSKQVALKLSEVDALTARTATIASDALTVAEATRADSAALVNTLTKHFDDTISKLQSSLHPTTSNANTSHSSPPDSSTLDSPNKDSTTSRDGSGPSAESVTPPHAANHRFRNVSSHLQGDQPAYDSDAAYAAAHPASSPDRSDDSPDDSYPSGGFSSPSPKRVPYLEREYNFDKSPDKSPDSASDSSDSRRKPSGRRKDWTHRNHTYDPRRAYNGGGGDGDDDGSGDGGDGLSPRMGHARSPRQRAALMKDLGDDILLWHAGSKSDGDPIDGIDLMDSSDVEDLGVDPTYSAMISTEHLELLDNWSNPRWVSHDVRHYGDGYTPSALSGPNTTDILKQISGWEKLSDLTPTGWQAFYKKLRRYSFRWKIALVPFEAITLRYECQGHCLCLCGLGLTRWRKMGDALFMVLEYLLPTTDQRVTTAIDNLANGSLTANGYELLWILMKQFIPMFDRTVPSQLPSWPDSDDLFQYARLITMYCDMSRHSGTRFTEAMKSRMFLRGVQGRYIPIANQFRALVRSYCPGKDGVIRNTAALPRDLTIMELASSIADEAAESLHTTLHPQTFRTQQLPSLTSTTNSQVSTLTPTTGHSNPNMPQQEDHTQSARPSHLQGFSASLTRARGPRGRSAPNPTSRASRPPQQPRHLAPCEACGKFGHPASRCDMLAMAIFVNRYSRNRDNATAIREIEARWVERNKPHLPRDDRSPRTILANYCAEMDFSEEQVDFELDWDYLHDPSGAEEAFDE